MTWLLAALCIAYISERTRRQEYLAPGLFLLAAAALACLLTVVIPVGIPILLPAP